MPGRDVIVIGASAGGLQALEDLVGGLPKDLAASLFIVVHTSPTANGMLPQILTRHSRLPVEFAVDRTRIRPGHVYVARPDHHLLIAPGQIRVTRGPKENGFRPAVDPLFRTAARTYGRRVVGVVLSGGLNDGTVGLSIIKHHGGIVICQDPADASFPSMPLSAVQNVEVDQILRAADISAALDELARTPIPREVAAMATPRRNEQPDVAEEGSASLANNDRSYSPSLAAQEMENRAGAVRKILISEPQEAIELKKVQPGKLPAAHRNSRNPQGRPGRANSPGGKAAGAKGKRNNSHPSGPRSDVSESNRGFAVRP
ncbi:MAG TPA: chemotaxis protein CheB [Tepidisphaeraceae bacterium]|jgi:two-component system chemotaxis response regulator CheB